METETKWLEACQYEYDPKVKIPSILWLGMEWNDDQGVRYISKGEFQNGKRVARFYTYSMGGMHYYGRIEVPTPEGVTGDGGWHGGYMGKEAPRFTRLSINVTRRLTKVEKDMAGDIIGKIGEHTYRFNEAKDVLPAALKLFKKKFGPGWVLLDEQGENICET